VVGREREVSEGSEREARSWPEDEHAEEGVVGEQRGLAPQEDKVRVGKVVGGGERGEEGGKVASFGLAVGEDKIWECDLFAVGGPNCGMSLVFGFVLLEIVL
jgi:hypothetical protein